MRDALLIAAAYLALIYAPAPTYGLERAGPDPITAAASAAAYAMLFAAARKAPPIIVAAAYTAVVSAALASSVVDAARYSIPIFAKAYTAAAALKPSHAAAVIAAVAAAPSLVPYSPRGPWPLHSYLHILYFILYYAAYEAPGRGEKLSRAGLAVVAAVMAVLAASLGLLGFKPIIVASGSMSPSIEPGDLVIVVPGAPKLGDVAVYRSGHGLVVHRVVGYVDCGAEKCLVTKGDANPVPDPEPVPPDRVVGRVALVLKGAGKPLMVLKTLPGVAAMSALVAAVVLAEYAYTRRRNLKNF